MQNVHFSPPQLAPLFGVNVSTIKRWVDKGFLKSEVTAGGHRRISASQLHNFVQSYPKIAVSSYAIKRILALHKSGLGTLQKKYAHYICSGEDAKAFSCLERLFVSQYSVADILEHIVSPTLRYIGDLWEKKKIEVFDEHRMSFLIRSHLIAFGRYIQPTSLHLKHKKVILACAPSEHHELPLHMISLIVWARGLEPVILGINIPAGQLRQAIAKMSPTLVCISKVYSHDLRGYVQQLKNLGANFKVPIFLGGVGWKKTLTKNVSGWLRYIPDLYALDKSVQGMLTTQGAHARR